MRSEVSGKGSSERVDISAVLPILARILWEEGVDVKNGTSGRGWWSIGGRRSGCEEWD